MGSTLARFPEHPFYLYRLEDTCYYLATPLQISLDTVAWALWEFPPKPLELVEATYPNTTKYGHLGERVYRAVACFDPSC